MAVLQSFRAMVSPSQLKPALPLFFPVGHGSDRQHVAHLHAILTSDGRWPKENLFLEVGGQAQQTHDLADARPGDVA